MSALSDWRPIRPKPLIPTRVAMVRDPPVGLGPAEAGRVNGHVTAWGRERWPYGRSAAPPGWIVDARRNEGLRASEGNVLAKLRRYDADRGRQARETLARDGVLGQAEHPLPLRLGDGPTDDDPVRVERVDEPDARRRHSATCPVHQLPAG